MKYLTERQRDILQFIREFQQERGVAPTHREICDRFGFSSYGTVYKHLSLLEKKGLIRRDWNQKRGVEVVDQEKPVEAPPGVRELPLFGVIAAGRPLEVDVSTETIRSICANVMPLRCISLATAGTGPIPIRDGSQPAAAQPTK